MISSTQTVRSIRGRYITWAEGHLKMRCEIRIHVTLKCDCVNCFAVRHVQQTICAETQFPCVFCFFVPQAMLFWCFDHTSRKDPSCWFEVQAQKMTNHDVEPFRQRLVAPTLREVRPRYFLMNNLRTIREEVRR